MRLLADSKPLKYGLYYLQAILCCAFSFTATAQNQFNLNDLNQGQLILNLSATEQVSVDQDMLNVAMQYSIQGRNTADLQNEVNEVVREALNILEDTNNINYSTQQYHVYNTQGRFDPGQVANPIWRAEQSIQMSSMNSEALLVVTARLQELGLIVGNMNYSLSSEKYEEISDSLMNAALQKLQARANEAADTLNKASAELVEVSLNGGNGASYNRNSLSAAMMNTRAGGGMAVPAAEPGSTQVSLTVSARALLSP